MVHSFKHTFCVFMVLFPPPLAEVMTCESVFGEARKALPFNIMSGNMYVQLFFLLKAALAPEMWPRSITRRSEADSPNTILHGGLQVIDGLPLNFGNTIPGAPVKGDIGHFSKGAVLPDPIAFFRAVGLGLIGTSDMLSKSRHHAWQVAVALASADNIGDTSTPDLLALAPSLWLQLLLNLRKEILPSMVSMKSI